MIKTNFLEWVQYREEQADPFITLQQKAGDVAYFGVHDLAKFYKANKSLPTLGMDQIQLKTGQVVDADPVNQTITVATQQAPYHYGYRKLDGSAKKKTDEQGQNLVTIPVTSLQNVSHMFDQQPEGAIWLVVDGNTKYQQGLMRAIRKEEFQKAHASQQPEMDPNMGMDDTGMDQDMSGMGPDMGMDPNMMGQNQPQMQGMDPNMGMQGMSGMGPDMGMDPSMMGDPTAMAQPPQPQFQMKNRQVVPAGQQLDLAHFDPTITSKDRFWKRHNDRRFYGYYPV